MTPIRFELLLGNVGGLKDVGSFEDANRKWDNSTTGYLEREGRNRQG